MVKRFKLVESREFNKGYEVYITKEEVLSLVKQLKDKKVSGFFIPMEKLK